MRYVRRVGFSVLIAVLYLACAAVPVGAVVTVVPDPIPTPESLPTSLVMITAYQVNASSLQFVQLYNNSDELISLDGGALMYGYASDTPAVPYEAVKLSGLMKPRTHLLVSVEGLLDGAALRFHFADTTAPDATTINMLAFVLPGMAPSLGPTTIKSNGSIQQRSKTTTGYSTVTWGDFKDALYADSLYETPPPPALQIVEVAARADSCDPFATELTCGDFVKLKILPGYDDAYLALYRLRSDDANESVTNTFSLEYASRQGDFVLVRLRDDGQNLSLTNSGGFVWLEDIYGEHRYEETLVPYADAGSETYIGKSWALDDSDGVWKWATPNPTGVNQFPQVLAESIVVPPTPSDCPVGKYRNPETNRCRSIEEAVSALAVCEEGKERNPVTNRCRSIATTSSSNLTPCEEGEERNPVTNRCRSLLANVSTPAPCQDGYERNPSTNRCRKTVVAGGTPVASPAAAAIDAAGGSSLKTALIVTAGLGAFGYGFYEWRSELWRAFRRLATFVSGK